MSDLLRRTEKGKQRSRIIRLIITTTGRFLESNVLSNFPSWHYKIMAKLVPMKNDLKA